MTKREAVTLLWSLPQGGVAGRERDGHWVVRPGQTHWEYGWDATVVRTPTDTAALRRALKAEGLPPATIDRIVARFHVEYLNDLCESE